LKLDHNGAFSHEKTLIPIKNLAKTHSIKCVDGYFNALELIESDIKNSQKYDVILVQGHGLQDEVPLSTAGYGLSDLRDLGRSDRYGDAREPEKKLPSGLAQIIKENGKIILVPDHISL
jgi:hypothetical protein